MVFITLMLLFMNLFNKLLYTCSTSIKFLNFSKNMQILLIKYNFSKQFIKLINKNKITYMSSIAYSQISSKLMK